MSTPVRVPINGRNLTAARENAGLSLERAAARLQVSADKVSGWESEQIPPTLTQLRHVASILGTTMAALMSPHPIAVDSVVRQMPDFRREHDHAISESVNKEIRQVRKRRSRLLDLDPQLPQLPTVELSAATVEAVASTVRERTGVSIDQQRRFADVGAALREWVHALERMGVLVFQASRIPTSEFLGLSIFEPSAPIILLNGADSPDRRIFTLFHELGHLLRRTSGLCDVFTAEGNEALCNSFASAFLLPREAIAAELETDDPIGSLDRLSRRFRVSQSAVAVRLKTLGYIDGSQLAGQLAIAREVAQRKRSDEDPSGFAPPHILKLRNLGGMYVSTVLDAMNDGRISLVDATYYLETKLPTIDRIEQELARRAIG
ncbi:helix-turn-helix domain-containing protein [Nocardia rosealba]|uniref:helix-turn-helix domain-containing protein n=1 Tax=Nocardia rosealba TaxID=2878563 RepID=UPI001CD93755|nr:XRE family transcriptional regulator [Nocardia rosealba]MCA2210571.1 XRE family transcriptional regulator [Nocardia rosealba]